MRRLTTYSTKLARTRKVKNIVGQPRKHISIQLTPLKLCNKSLDLRRCRSRTDALSKQKKYRLGCTSDVRKNARNAGAPSSLTIALHGYARESAQFSSLASLRRASGVDRLYSSLIVAQTSRSADASEGASRPLPLIGISGAVISRMFEFFQLRVKQLAHAAVANYNERLPWIVPLHLHGVRDARSLL